MTNTQFSDTMMITNPVLTVAPIKEETEMLGATTDKLLPFIADCLKRMKDWASPFPSRIRKPFCFNMPVTIDCQIPPFSWMMDTVV